MAKKKKEVKAEIRLQIPAGQATPAPPVGPALGQHGVNIMDFCKKFNEATKKQIGMVVPVIIYVYKDRSFDFVVKKPPVSVLLKKALNIEKGSGEPNKKKVGKITMDKIKEIAKMKMEDMNTDNLESAIKMVIGTAKSMGIEVVEE